MPGRHATRYAEVHVDGGPERHGHPSPRRLPYAVIPLGQQGGDARRPRSPSQWLSDNESMYTARETVVEAEGLTLAPVTTPARSPQSNGMSGAFVNRLRRVYIAGADLATAAALLEQIPA